MKLEQQPTAKKASKKCLNADDWRSRLQIHLDSLTPDQLFVVYHYWPFVKKGIKAATQYDNLNEYEGFEEKTESFEYALLIQGSSYFTGKRPSVRIPDDPGHGFRSIPDGIPIDPGCDSD